MLSKYFKAFTHHISHWRGQLCQLIKKLSASVLEELRLTCQELTGRSIQADSLKHFISPHKFVLKMLGDLFILSKQIPFQIYLNDPL